jgi:hypothetical protein
MAKRVIKVDPDFFIKMLSYLKPDERFLSERGGIIMLSPMGHNTLLEFSPHEGEDRGNGAKHESESG